MPPTLPTADLAARIRAAARGSYSHEAAAELLIAHHTWLTRRDFVEACTYDFTAPDRSGALVPMVGIDWDTIPAFLPEIGCAGSERRILLLAAELAGTTSGEPLAELLSSLDEHNIARVLGAIARAAGWHARHLTHTVTGYATPADRYHGAEEASAVIAAGLGRVLAGLVHPPWSAATLDRWAHDVLTGLTTAGYRLVKEPTR